MKITLDSKACEKHGLTIEETLLILTIRKLNINKAISKLTEKEILHYDNAQKDYFLTQHWDEVMEEILCDSNAAVDDEERLLNLAKKMRECFPEGRMPGTAYYYRCNNREVVLKLKKFFIQYGNYSDEKIIDATKRFVASFQGNYRYLPLIKYFISKNKMVTDEDGTNHVSEVSLLSSYLENKEDKEQVANDDWLMTSRN